LIIDRLKEIKGSGQRPEPTIDCFANFKIKETVCKTVFVKKDKKSG